MGKKLRLKPKKENTFDEELLEVIHGQRVVCHICDASSDSFQERINRMLKRYAEIPEYILIDIKYSSAISEACSDEQGHSRTVIFSALIIIEVRF